MHKSPGVDQIPAELIQAGGESLHTEIHKLSKLIWNKKRIAIPVERISCLTYSQKG
jgi:hypothetical protein